MESPNMLLDLTFQIQGVEGCVLCTGIAIIKQNIQGPWTFYYSLVQGYRLDISPS